MRLKSIKIQNFRKLNDVEINFGDATFLIGANNAGKFSTLDVVEYLVTDRNSTMLVALNTLEKMVRS